MTRREKPNAGRPMDKVELTFKKFDANKVYLFHSSTTLSWPYEKRLNFFNPITRM